MAKWYGVIAFAETAQTAPSVWEEQITKRSYYGDLTRNFSRLDHSNQVNDSVNISNTISIVADPYANQNFHAMRYVEFMGARWKVTSVEVQYPRLILSIGGLYNE